MLVILLLTVALPQTANSDGFFKRVISQDWVQDGWLKYGQIGSLCVAQTMNGLVESHKYSGDKITNDDNYHIFRYGQNISMIASGYFITANVRNKDLKWTTKLRRVVGSTLVARNFFEFAYRANRTGDPFFYGDMTFNDKSLVFVKFSFSQGKFVEFYVSGHGSQGVLIDMACLGLGLLIYD